MCVYVVTEYYPDTELLFVCINMCRLVFSCGIELVNINHLCKECCPNKQLQYISSVILVRNVLIYFNIHRNKQNKVNDASVLYTSYMSLWNC